MSLSNTPLWEYDEIQFARLLDELDAAGLDEETLETVAGSMGLSHDALMSLFERAGESFDYIEENRPLSRPLTVAEARERADKNGDIVGVVAVDLSDLIDNNLESFLDVIGEALVENGELLTATTYSVAAHNGNTLLLEVSGDASQIFDLAEGGDDADGQ